MKIRKSISIPMPLSFEGKKRSCVKFGKAKGGVLRCVSFEEGRKFPKCPGVGLKGGGRSQHYIRGKDKTCGKRGGRAK